MHELLDGLEIAGRGSDDRLGHGVTDRRDDHAGDFAGILGEDAFQVGNVAVLELLGELPHGLRHAAVVLDAPVAPAVVAAARDHVAADVVARIAKFSGKLPLRPSAQFAQETDAFSNDVALSHTFILRVGLGLMVSVVLSGCSPSTIASVFSAASSWLGA